MRNPFPTLSDIEAEHINTVLGAYGNNLAHAAKALGISRSTLYRKLDRTVKPKKKKKSR